MPHETTLIATIAAAFVLAFALGLAAARLRLPPLVGYLVAGILIGPFTPGYVADASLAAQLAEIGVILLMFGVGLHFSVKDLMSVRDIAIPGAIAQIATATLIGALIARAWGWGWGGALVFGLSLSVASTVVLLRALEERNALHTRDGRIAVGWLIVEDLVMVLALVLLPAVAESMGGSSRGLVGGVADDQPALAILATLGKVGLFVALALLVGTRVVPWLLMQVTRTGSRELFTLAVLATALGIAYGSAALFGVSFALGAFFAGVILNESDLSHKAAADSLPLQDAFAVLFFVSVGMLFDPSIVLRDPLGVAAVLFVIVVVKSLAALLIVLACGYALRTALTVSASLAQIGEFSFILAGLGILLGLLPDEGRDLILAGSLLSITLNPLTFAGIPVIERTLRSRPAVARWIDARGATGDAMAGGGVGVGVADHVVVIGHGRVGAAITPQLAAAGVPFVVVEQDRRLVDALLATGATAVCGDANAPGVLEAAGVARARQLVVAVPDGFLARRVLERARELHPSIAAIVRTHDAAGLASLRAGGADVALMGEQELARGMAAHAIARHGGTPPPAPGTPAAEGPEPLR